MSPPIIPRDQVAERLEVPVRILIRYEARGLVRAVRAEGVEGYAPGDVRRLWAIVSYNHLVGLRNQGLNVITAIYDGPSDEPTKATKMEHLATLSFVLPHAPE